MKSAHLALCTLLLSPALIAYAARQILPAGSLINCTVSETKIVVEDDGGWRSGALPGKHYVRGTAARVCRSTRISKAGSKTTRIPDILSARDGWN